MSCSICDEIPAKAGKLNNDEPMPPAASLLNGDRDWGTDKPPIGGRFGLWECPECGAFYEYTLELSFDDYWYGVWDNEKLDRLTREQSDAMHAMIEGRADAAAQAEFFALPDIAFHITLLRANQQAQSFVATLIPRVVPAAATRPYETRFVLYELVAEHASAMLAAIEALPAELRDNFKGVEENCRAALTK